MEDIVIEWWGVCVCARLADVQRENWQNSRGKNKNHRKWVILVQEFSSLWPWKSHIESFSTQNRFDGGCSTQWRAALVQLLSHVQIKIYLLLMTFVERNLVLCLYKTTLTYICYCNLGIMMILGQNYPIKQTYYNRIYLVIYVSLFVPDTSFSRVRLHCIANICYCCLNPFW